MSSASTEAKADNIPNRLESIEELLANAHTAVSRLCPQDNAKDGAQASGVEASVCRIQAGLRELVLRIDSIADTIGQL